MSDFLSMYSVQHWLESCPQGYLMGTEYGHAPGAREPELILENEVLRTETIRTTVQLVMGERCALAASSGLINAAPDEASKRFLATQTLDEARHVEIFTQRLYDLGVKKADLESVLTQYANPNLVKFAETLLEKVDKKDFVSGVVGQNVILEGMAFSVFEMMQALSQDVNPTFASTLSGTIADERRHVGFGENIIGQLIRQHPEKKPEIERMQRDMSYYMLATFADSFRGNRMAIEIDRLEEEAGLKRTKAEYQGVDLARMEPEEMEKVLADTVLKEFKIRLGRIGLEYQTPRTP
ncbi:ferritin-like domain-containing protein [Myxococcota bacterium]|nr:ferritin-like domain-containing protein [Myxococcota bacterium]MCZ7617963.1 ferritin-like domain-containing protein [Myxococcota bacterium]